jgi:hypothetical protein
MPAALFPCDRTATESVQRADPVIDHAKRRPEMRTIAALTLVAALTLPGCRYEAPLTRDHKIPIDPALLGLWEEMPNEDEESKTPDRMLVFRYSPTEYLVHYPLGEGGFYFRAYPIEVADTKCVQLEIIGTESGSSEETERKLFDVVTYRLAGSTLEVRTLNSALVTDDLATTDGLARAFRAHRNEKELFTEPGRFRRVGN